MDVTICRKRCISLLLAVCVVLSILPTVSLAAEPDSLGGLTVSETGGMYTYRYTDVTVSQTANTLIAELLAPEGSITLPAGEENVCGTKVKQYIDIAGKTADQISAYIEAMAFSVSSPDAVEVHFYFSDDKLPAPGEKRAYFNEHFYEYVREYETWTDAVSIAASKTLFGMQGYLATVSSAEENTMIAELKGLDYSTWLGGRYLNINGTNNDPYCKDGYGWYWILEPDADERVKFGDKSGAGSIAGVYENWAKYEPNGVSNGEYYVEMKSTYDKNASSTGYLWNDLGLYGSNDPRTTQGYTIEYSGKSSLQPDLTGTLQSFVVTYDANNGTGAPAQQLKARGQELVLDAAEPSRTGFSFTGWNTAANGSGTAYESGGMYDGDADVTLYAQWTPVASSGFIFVEVYDADTGVRIPGIDLKFEVRKYATPYPSTGYPGYVDGEIKSYWFTAANDGTASLSIAEIKDEIDAIGVGSVLEINPETDSASSHYGGFVYMDPNAATAKLREIADGHSGIRISDPETENKHPVAVVTDPAQISYTLKLYVVCAHAKSQEGLCSETGCMHDTTGNTCCGKQYTLQFDANAGGDSSVTGMPATPAVGTSSTGTCTLRDLPQPERAGHSFLGWSLDADAESGSQSITLHTYQDTAYAVWEKNSYTITWLNGDGTALKTEQVPYGEMPVYTGPNPIKEGGEHFSWVFNGTWDPTIQPVTGTQTYAPLFDQEVDQHTVIFMDEDGETVLLASKDYPYNTPAEDILQPDAPTKPATEEYSFSFAGWTPAIAAVTSDVVYKASYTPVPVDYTITFVNTGDTVIDPITQGFGTVITAPADPTKEGHTFAGWDVEIPTTMPAQNLTITAKWNTDTYTITFANTGDSTIAPITQEYGTAITAPANPTKEGHTFAGWDVEIPTTMPAENLTITACWEPVSYTIRFAANGGTGTMADLAMTYNQTKNLPANQFAWEGYVFDGWMSDTQERFEDQASVCNLAAVHDAVVTLTAQWAEDRNQNGTADDRETFTVIYTDGVEGMEVFEDQIFVGLAAGDPTPAFYGTPHRLLYFFVGWEPAYADTVDPDMADADGTIVYTAKWQFNHLLLGAAAEPTVKVRNLNTVDHMAYVVGYSNGCFLPRNHVTRAEAATMFFRLLEDDFRNYYWDDSCSYSDVREDDWFCVAVSTLEAADILRDTAAGGAFRPNAPITRAELAVMAAQFADVTGSVGRSSFLDVGYDHWAADEIAVVEYAGWIEGYAGHFRPEDKLTRAECVTVINRMLSRGAEAAHMLPDRITFRDNLPGDWFYEAVLEAANSHTYSRTDWLLTGEVFEGEQWNTLEPAPDWAALERIWAMR